MRSTRTSRSSCWPKPGTSSYMASGHERVRRLGSPNRNSPPLLERRKESMIYELRISEAVPGRLPDLHSRFANITLKIWERFGIEQVGFWTAEVGVSNELTYLLKWESMAERDRS